MLQKKLLCQNEKILKYNEVLGFGMADSSAQSTAPSGGVAVMWFIVNTWSPGDTHLMPCDTSLRSANTFTLVSSLS